MVTEKVKSTMCLLSTEKNLASKVIALSAKDPDLRVVLTIPLVPGKWAAHVPITSAV